MSGHSMWSTIKHKKAAADAKRGKVFTRLGREITIAARSGGDPDNNFALRLVVDRAKAANMPKDNIERAIKRGTGELKDAEEIVEMMYEVYGPSGVALIVEVATDNRNRTLAEIKHQISRAGGSMAEPGSVGWQFEQKGYMTIPAGEHDFDEIFMIAADAGAEDVVDDEELIEVFTPRELLHAVMDAFREAGIYPEETRLDWVPKISLDLETDAAMKVMGLIEDLEELDDTQMVFSNLNITDDLMMSFEAGS
jgi:YebC/PmpR family DNA-binding regulatory protein